MIFLSSCASAPPTLFEVKDMCEEGKVEHYKVRNKEETLDFKCRKAL